MTVVSTVVRAAAAWTGAETEIPTGIQVQDRSQLVVSLVPDDGERLTLSLGLHYTITLSPAGGATVVPLAAFPAMPGTVSMVRQTPMTQVYDPTATDTYDAAGHAAALDRSAMRVAELSVKVDDIAASSIIVAGGAASVPAGAVYISDGGGGAVAGPTAPEIEAARVAAVGAAATATGAASVAADAATAADHAADRAETAAATVEGTLSYAVEQDLTTEEKARAQANLGLEGLQNALTPFGFTAAAGQTAFALGMSPLPSACIFSLNGAWLTGGGVDYTVAGSTLTLASPAEAGDRIAGVAIAPFTVANAMLSAANLADLANVAVARANLGLGSAAVLNAGTGANQLLKLDGAGKIPAVDGSQITGLPFSKGWESAEITIAGGNIYALTHTLGATPKLIDAVLVCKIAEHGFSIDDEYRISGVIIGSGNPPLVSFASTASDITAIFQSSSAYYIMHKTTRAWVNPTFGNWKLKIRAFA